MLLSQLPKSFGVIGGNIEGHKPFELGQIVAGMCTVFDIPVEHGKIRSACDNNLILSNFNEIKQHHKFVLSQSPEDQRVGFALLAESIIDGFDVQKYFQQQVDVVKYYAQKYDDVHVHVHRGETPLKLLKEMCNSEQLRKNKYSIPFLI